MERTDPQTVNDERTCLRQFLDYYRATLVLKAEGLTDEQARWSPVKSGTSVMGLIRHMADVEHWWFAKFIGGSDEPFHYQDEKGDDTDWLPGPDDTLAEAIATFTAACERSRAVEAALPTLDEIRTHPRRGDVDARWVMVHMIEETARHAGHMDIIREQIDEVIGD